ncbi:hypothetical protein KAU11_00505 [Candidatus Babeliales bacterium]|nr:hypothetical protein [Candidatus Babeliales bacterium]
MKEKLLLWHPESPGERVVVYRGIFKRLIYPTAFATLNETMKSSQIDLTKADLFVKHIQGHLCKGDKVMCKICGKTIDEIQPADIADGEDRGSDNWSKEDELAETEGLYER